MPAEGKLSYQNKQACIADAKAKGMNVKLCANLPDKNAEGINKPGTFQPKGIKNQGGNRGGTPGGRMGSY